MHTTRESWLLAAIAELRPLFTAANLKVPSKVKVSCGFPGNGSRVKKIGECWVDKAEIFVSPLLAEENRVLDVLVHELIHASLPPATIHKRPFKDAMKAIGLEGKATATTATAELVAKFKPIIKTIGTYPHTALVLNGHGKKQTTRLLKMSCSGCEFVVRVTQKWIDQMEHPQCWCCGAAMVIEQGESDED